jgi:polyhydroxyalkanoate synthesis regulator protein
MENLSREQQKLREQMAQTFGPKAFEAMQEQVRTNMAFFSDAMRMFTPFSGKAGTDGKPASPEADIDALKAQMADMQAKLEALAKK